jgi:hypothetical protein
MGLQKSGTDKLLAPAEMICLKIELNPPSLDEFAKLATTSTGNVFSIANLLPLVTG